MFGNFIQFIVVLLIYATYQPVGETNFTLVESIFLFLCLAILFTGQAWISFRLLEKRVSKEALNRLDHRYSTLVLRQSILAIGLFAIDIYGLNLTSFLAELPFFSAIPTLQALFCIGIFIGYLSTIWSCAYGAYQHIYPTRLTKASYIKSNITFSVPVLLPWLVLSGVSDLILLLPFEWTRWLLSSTMGQIFYFLFFLIGIALIGPSMIQKFWQCKPMENNLYRERIEALCAKAGMRYRDILYWPIFGGRMITAGIMGLVKNFRFILVTKALLHYLAPDELDAVIAHEIGHVKKHHLLFYLMFFSGFMLLSFSVQNVFIYAFIYTKPIYELLSGSGLAPMTIKSALDAMLFILVFLVYFRFIFGFFMRNFERQADAYVYTQFDSAVPLVSTLRKIAFASGQPLNKPNWHHFSIGERIGFLEKCEADRRWISRHDRKITMSIIGYLAGLIFMFAVGYQLSYGEGGRTFFRHQLIRHFQEELKISPQNPLMLTYLGDLYHEEGDLENTVAIYEKALAIEENNPHVLNNLAWIYATSHDKRFRNPGRALHLSGKAAQLEQSPQILDTLAESYYVNGDFQSAIEAGTKALESAGENRAYFLEQLKKFEDADLSNIQN